MLYTSFTGRTKQLVECLEISEIRGTAGLERMWQILDDAFEQMGYERMADAWKVGDVARRVPGQPMTDFIATLRKIKLGLVTQDQLSHISEEGFTSKLLRATGLPKKDQHQVVSHAGGVLKSEAVEAVLKTMYGRHHESERRLDGVWKPGLRPRGPPPPRTPAWSQNPQGPGGRFQSGARGPAGRYPSNPRRTYLQDDAEY